jgi:uncharacterized protein YfdQ (DUF2303 family)
VSEQPPEETTTSAEAPTQQAADQVNQVLSLDDHRKYSQELYGQPPYVIDGAMSAANMDTTVDYSTDDMKGYIDSFLNPTPPPEGQ